MEMPSRQRAWCRTLQSCCANPHKHNDQWGCTQFFVAIAGHSGAGKTASMKCARHLVPDIGTELDGMPISSGEGLVQAYLQQSKSGGVVKQRQVHSSGFFYVDEGQQLLSQSVRKGSTTLSMLRVMWAGETAGTTGAVAETTRCLKAAHYRLSLLVGLQPEFASALLADDHAGTPQRFLWLSCRDPEPPSRRPASGAPLHIPPLTEAPVKLDSKVEYSIDQARLEMLKNGGNTTSLASQRTRLQLRTSYLIAVLHGRSTDINRNDWDCGADLVTHSQTVALTIRDLVAESRRAEQARVDLEDAERAALRLEHKQRANIERVARRAARHIHQSGYLSTPDLRRKLAYRDREYFEEAMQHALKCGLVEAFERGFSPASFKPNDSST